MYILGIDTSCDDTSAAILRNGKEVLSNVINSQIRLHHPYGGVVPELASREHVRNIIPVVEEALTLAGIDLKELDGIAVTIGPGLIGSLLVGLYFSKALSFVNSIPLIAVNHLEGHILSVLLEENPPEFPFIALTVSGGHTSIYHVEGIGKYELMGQTLDDAAGEAFDKIAKILGLGYPGGPVIEAAALKGDSLRLNFPRARTQRPFDFSFSGLKTSVSQYVEKWEKGNDRENGIVTREDISASFQKAVIDALIEKLISAGREKGVYSLVIAGGVACNNALKSRIRNEADKSGMKARFPRPAYCTDNGAMIALAGYYRLLKGERADQSTDVRSRYPIYEIEKCA